MREKVFRRLHKLEQVQEKVLAAIRSRERQDDGDRAIHKFELFHQMRGTEQGPLESLFEASARALEISCDELREQLEEGIDPINKYLTDHGVFEEIKRRKADRTRPSG